MTHPENSQSINQTNSNEKQQPTLVYATHLTRRPRISILSLTCIRENCIPTHKNVPNRNIKRFSSLFRFFLRPFLMLLLFFTPQMFVSCCFFSLLIRRIVARKVNRRFFFCYSHSVLNFHSFIQQGSGVITTERIKVGAVPVWLTKFRWKFQKGKPPTGVGDDDAKAEEREKESGKQKHASTASTRTCFVTNPLSPLLPLSGRPSLIVCRMQFC